MKKLFFFSLKLIVPILCVISVFGITNCTKPSQKPKNDTEIQSISKAVFLEQILDFEASLKILKASNHQAEAQELYPEVFQSFKRFGFLLEYFDASLYNIFNGAPIAKEDAGNPYPNVIPPKGLQVIAEIVYNDSFDLDELKTQINWLIYQLKFVREIAESIDFNAQMIYQAIEQHTIRFETLSMSGFDNATLQNEFQYLANELDALNHYLSLVAEKHYRLEIKYDSTLVTNKLQFLKEKWYPFKRQLSERTAYEPTISPIRYQYSNIYDAQFLNASFFSKNGMVETTSEDKLKLGKMLFNDPLLSNKTVSFSCATCHLPERFFMDGLPLGKSNFAGLELMRNTPTLIHAAYQSKLMYDGRANSLEEQMLHVFRNDKEFKTNLTEMITAIEGQETYQQSFKGIYPEMTPNAINLYSITDAMATYVRSLDGHQSAFDQYMSGEIDFLDTDALKGFNLFMGKAKCGTCHFAPTFSGLLPLLFVDSEFENLGVPGNIENGTWTKDFDLGRYQFYANDKFKHFFKTSTIRNVEHTAPYMHNGVFKTLEEVMAFYNEGGGVGHGLDYPNQTLSADVLGLTEVEMQQIIAFMKSLTDKRYLEY
jgi:cytochrome c peroxidase